MKMSTHLISLPGLTNVGKLADGVYRMGWPDDPLGYETLRDMGIAMRVNLRTSHSDEKQCTVQGIKYVAWPIDSLLPPKLDRLREVVDVISNPQNWPVVFGCALGSDRTGLVALLYRVWVEGWSIRQAKEEFAGYVNPQLNFELWPGIRERIEELSLKNEQTPKKL